MKIRDKAEEMYKVDVLADKENEYFSIPDEDELAYTGLLFVSVISLGFVITVLRLKKLLFGRSHARHMRISKCENS